MLTTISRSCFPSHIVQTGTQIRCGLLNMLYSTKLTRLKQSVYVLFLEQGYLDTESL